MRMATDPQHATATPKRVPWNQLIAYGMGGLIPIALFNIAGQLMQLLGNISLGLSAFWLGTIMIVPRLWEAFSDPIIGHLSDNTRTRWGRRRPYLLAGGLTVALSFVAMWWVPRGEWIREIFVSDEANNWFQLVYILVGVLLFYTACAVFEIPHGALGLEMSPDSHERTRLLSAKSFFGNLFAIGTPGLFWLAGRDWVRGPGGDMIDGMRQLAIAIAALLIPMTIWWFVALREPGFVIAKKQAKTTLTEDLRTTISNSTFLHLVAIVFILAMGFNFVQIFSYYITIFYLYAGDEVAAGWLLWVNGIAWAVTGVLAVFPLNWISKRLSKNRTLALAIVLMCAAQLSKIVCYNPELPYLVLIPTVLLSAGMLMFFTLGASMVGDVCDGDELQTGTRSEGSFYAVYWWFIKMGSAVAGFGMGALLVLTAFDEKQNVSVDALRRDITTLKVQAETWQREPASTPDRMREFDLQVEQIVKRADELQLSLQRRLETQPSLETHIGTLRERLEAIRSAAAAMSDQRANLVAAPDDAVRQADALLEQVGSLRHQSPLTLFRLRLFEIGIPLVLSGVSLALAMRYPLTDARWREIRSALDKRHAERTAQQA
jgi:GPH family glycoside/pentoside/hexuronide:cation symporter